MGIVLEFRVGYGWCYDGFRVGIRVDFRVGYGRG